MPGLSAPAFLNFWIILQGKIYIWRNKQYVKYIKVGGAWVSKFYTVDRRLLLEKDQIITLKKYNDVAPDVLKFHINTLFPKGLSFHGENYLLQNRTPEKNEVLELVFEYIRQAHFPEKPSRLQSMFACGLLEEALEFRNKYADHDHNAAIWEVECDFCFRGDMKLVHMPTSIIVLSYYAHLYWNGDPGSETPFWEYLLTPPIKVIRKIE